VDLVAEIEMTEHGISELEDTLEEITLEPTQTEKQRETD
jgi:hypothetical protein